LDKLLHACMKQKDILIHMINAKSGNN